MAPPEWNPRPGLFARAALAAALLLAPAAAHAQNPAAILHTVDAHYNHLQSLQARYTEHYTGMGMDRTETGTLLLKKPGRMKWLYDTPPGKLFLLDGKDAWFYTPGDPQAQRLPAKQLDDLRSPLRFLLGHTQLSRELDHPTVKLLPSGAYEITGGAATLNRRLERLTLTVQPNGQITTLSLQQQDGATTTFTFTHLQENPRSTDADFRFTPPPGVTVVDALPPI